MKKQRSVCTRLFFFDNTSLLIMGQIEALAESFLFPSFQTNDTEEALEVAKEE
jgi:hypothetical protein